MIPDKERELIVAQLDMLTNDDPEAAHSSADATLYNALFLFGGPNGKLICEAWDRAKQRCRFWYS